MTDPYDWRQFLSQWAHDLFDDENEEVAARFPPEVRVSHWPGYPGATEAQIARAEARLGVTLPPSYRAFLQSSNGWHRPSRFIDRLWSVEEITWFAEQHQEFIALWGDGPVPDEEYFVYGDEQTVEAFRAVYFQTALQISDWGDVAIYLLNPQVVTAEGEWEAWFYASWLPGAHRYRSFQEMIQDEYEMSLQWDKHSWSFGPDDSE